MARGNTAWKCKPYSPNFTHPAVKVFHSTFATFTRCDWILITCKSKGEINERGLEGDLSVWSEQELSAKRLEGKITTLLKGVEGESFDLIAVPSWVWDWNQMVWMSYQADFHRSKYLRTQMGKFNRCISWYWMKNLGLRNCFMKLFMKFPSKRYDIHHNSSSNERQQKGYLSRFTNFPINKTPVPQT